jgi:hypothetical protein
MQITGGGCKLRRCEEDDGGSKVRGRRYPTVVYPLIYRSMLMFPYMSDAGTENVQNV